MEARGRTVVQGHLSPAKTERTVITLHTDISDTIDPELERGDLLSPTEIERTAIGLYTDTSHSIDPKARSGIAEVSDENSVIA